MVPSSTPYKNHKQEKKRKEKKQKRNKNGKCGCRCGKVQISGKRNKE